MTRIAVIDHGAGNLVSMEQALRRVGADPTRVDGARDLTPFDGVVLPGVGATGAAMRTLRRRNLIDPILAYTGPLLGVCVGMQLLFERSDEDDNPCLGLLPGGVRRISARPLPHMGWNGIDPATDSLVRPLTPNDTVYFVHSFVPDPDDVANVTGWTSYGDDRFPSVVRAGRIVGVQFHPERSGAVGLDVLGRFVLECAGTSRAA